MSGRTRGCVRQSPQRSPVWELSVPWSCGMHEFINPEKLRIPYFPGFHHAGIIDQLLSFQPFFLLWRMRGEGENSKLLIITWSL